MNTASLSPSTVGESFRPGTASMPFMTGGAQPAAQPTALCGAASGVSQWLHPPQPDVGEAVKDMHGGCWPWWMVVGILRICMSPMLRMYIVNYRNHGKRTRIAWMMRLFGTLGVFCAIRRCPPSKTLREPAVAHGHSVVTLKYYSFFACLSTILYDMLIVFSL